MGDVSKRISSILNILLVILLCSSIYLSVRITSQGLREDSKLISIKELKVIEDELMMPTAVKADYSFSASLTTKDSVDIKDNIFVNTAKDKSETAEDLINKGPDTNLPVFLTNKVGEFSVVAISKNSNNSRVIIADNSSKQSYILEEGDVFKDFLVTKIETDLVILTKDEEEYRLNFSEKMRRL